MILLSKAASEYRAYAADDGIPEGLRRYGQRHDDKQYVGGDGEERCLGKGYREEGGCGIRCIYPVQCPILKSFKQGSSPRISALN